MYRKIDILTIGEEDANFIVSSSLCVKEYHKSDLLTIGEDNVNFMALFSLCIKRLTRICYISNDKAYKLTFTHLNFKVVLNPPTTTTHTNVLCVKRLTRICYV